MLSSKNIKLDNFVARENEIAAGAASEVLTYLFPDMKDKINKFSSIQIMLNKNNSDDITASTFESSKAFQHGQYVGKQVIEYAKNDGSNAVFNGTIPKGECKWTGTNPLEPVAGQWKTFILTSGSDIQPPPPLDCKSEEYKKQVQEIINASKNRSNTDIESIHLWGDTPPPTLWNDILDEYISHYDLSIGDSAQALAYLNVGMYDAGVSTWYTKFKYWTERPIQAAPDLVTVIPTPNFPGYTSGHSTFSGVASVILDEIFPKEKQLFESCADAANLSRFIGGIHLMQDCENGLTVGKLIGNKVIEDMKGPKHTFIYKG